MTILETPRLVLRELAAEDADALARILGDPETMRYYPAPYDRAGVEQWIARNRQRYKDDGVGLWGMVLKSTVLKSTPSQSAGELIGDCGIIRQEVEGEHLYEIGYHLLRDFWGRGLPRLGLRESENRSRDFSDSSRESRLPPRCRSRRHESLERSDPARPSALRLFHTAGAW